ncbi:thioredoxin family protein [Flavobacterium sp. LB2R40]|uniref:thioredoxin family protein n=1 Tax=unclassified Flavobacterium TaxID=196869 RepID=UPI003AAEE7C2
MKKIIVAVLLFAGSFAAEAQELVWETNVNKAMEISNETKKPLLLFFTGSDWCGWCIRLQKEVLRTPEFAAWAKENVVLVELDYPRKALQTPEIKKQNNELQMAFGIQGFPTIILANGVTKEGKVSFEGIGSTGYVAGGPSAWLAVANSFLKK